MQFAARAHRGQVRKGTEIPYIVHPIEAANIVSSIKNDETLITAALLHDTVEDCNHITVEVIEAEFGSRVASLVAAETEDKSKCWEDRKAATIRHLKEADETVKILSLGDKLSNMRDIYKDYRSLGDQAFNKFRVKDKNKIGWYYKGLRDSLSSLGNISYYQEYSNLVDEVFG